jgi:hypothetical protein
MPVVPKKSILKLEATAAKKEGVNGSIKSKSNSASNSKSGKSIASAEKSSNDLDDIFGQISTKRQQKLERELLNDSKNTAEIVKSLEDNKASVVVFKRPLPLTTGSSTSKGPNAEDHDGFADSRGIKSMYFNWSKIKATFKEMGDSSSLT